MTPFSGFPARSRYTAVPNLFFSSLLPEIDDMAELKTTLHLFRTLYPKKGYPRYVSREELLADRSLAQSLSAGGKNLEEALGDALDKAVKRGTILHLALDREGRTADVYFLNTEADRRAVEKIRNGELAIAGLKASGLRQPAPETPQPDIFTLYEENIGMLTPLIAEQLTEAEKLYPESWIKAAIREAASLGKHNWRYISRILENWGEKGRGDGAYRGDSKTGQDKYSGQKYGHIIKR